MAGLGRLDEVLDRWTWAEVADAHVLLDRKELAEERAIERSRGR